MTTRPIAQIEAGLKAATAKRNNFRTTANEGQGGYVDETEIEALTAELQTATAAASPLVRDLAGEREWAKAQGWTAKDVQAANKACLARGYSLAELQAAIKAAQ